MCLAMRNRYHVLAVTFDIVGLDILARSLIEQIFEIRELVCDGTGHRPHGVSQADGRALAWCAENVLVSRCYCCTGEWETYRFMAARYRYLCIMGIDG